MSTAVYKVDEVRKQNALSFPSCRPPLSFSLFHSITQLTALPYGVWIDYQDANILLYFQHFVCQNVTDDSWQNEFLQQFHKTSYWIMPLWGVRPAAFQLQSDGRTQRQTIYWIRRAAVDAYASTFSYHIWSGHGFDLWPHFAPNCRTSNDIQINSSKYHHKSLILTTFALWWPSRLTSNSNQFNHCPQRSVPNINLVKFPQAVYEIWRWWTFGSHMDGRTDKLKNIMAPVPDGSKSIKTAYA